MIDLFEALRLFTIYMCRLVGYHDLVKWWVKFIIGQFCRESRLPFSQITVPFTEKRLQRPESGIKLALKKWNTNSIRKNRSKRTTFSDVPLLGDIFCCRSDPKRRVSFTCQPDYQKNGARLSLQIDQPKEINWIFPQINKKVMLEVPSGNILPTLGGRAFYLIRGPKALEQPT